MERLVSTMPQSAPAQVFISYCHKDSQFLGELQEHLKPYERAGTITAWSDRQIAPGSKWFDEIKAALANARVVVMMVSPAFLASDFIHEHELGPLLKEAKQGGVCILWIPVRASSYQETAVKDYQAVLSPDKPLANMKAERDDAWVVVCKEIKKALQRGAGTQSGSFPFPSGPVAPSPAPVIHAALPQSTLVGQPGQTQMDQALIAAGGNPISPMGELLYAKK